MEFAIIKTGGKQYKVAKEEIIKLEKLPEALETIIEFPVMLLADKDGCQMGAPYLEGAKVKACVVEHGRGDKVTIIKFRRRKHHRKQMGHRQHYTAVKITEIITKGLS